MGTFTQDTRLARLAGPLGPDDLLLVRFSGEEALSRQFRFHLELQSEKRDIDPGSVLRKYGTLQVTLADESQRHINGMFSRFSQGTSDAELTTYWAELVPWTYFLSLRRNCRIFQKKSVIEILTAVFEESPYAEFEVRCGDRPARDFCVQYRESDLNFAQRLLEEEGIFYFFEHTEDKHKLVLADSNNHIPDCPPPTTVRALAAASPDSSAVTAFELENSVRIGAVIYRDYDHLQPSFTLDGEAPGEEGEEVYEYWPGHYTTRGEGERFAKYRLEAEEALREQARGRSTCRNLISGHKFTLEEHTNDRANQEYVLTSVRHVCNTGDYRSSGSDSFDYSNEFTVVPMSVPFRPRRTVAKPVIVGSQTAVVVGPSGEEIYTDEHGRVKLHFHWDREGKKNENDSCWIRVSQPWAGQGWGAVSIPRIGQEVVVDFLEGDPDQPIVTGRVYNAENKPPFGLPDNGMVSGIKSYSTPGGGGYNGIDMNDTKGKEAFNVHAQYDMTTMVLHDETHTVKNDRKKNVENDEVNVIKKNRTTEISEGDEKLSVMVGNRMTTIEAGDDTLTITAGQRSEVVKGPYEITVNSARFKIQCGASELILNHDGLIEIKGMDILVKANKDLSLQGMNVESLAKVSNNTKGAMVMSEAKGMNVVKGGMVQLNP
jgi:type VI secretion system secreted protein VgrG